MQNARTQDLREQIAKLVDEYATISLAPQAFLPGISAVPPSGKLLDGRGLSGWLAHDWPLQR